MHRSFVGLRMAEEKPYRLLDEDRIQRGNVAATVNGPQENLSVIAAITPSFGRRFCAIDT